MRGAGEAARRSGWALAMNRAGAEPQAVRTSWQRAAADEQTRSSRSPLRDCRRLMR